MSALCDRRFIMNFTPTGMIPSKHMTASVPVLVEEVVEHVDCAAQLGANMVHIHARDQRTGQPTCDKEIYARMIAGIRENHPDLVICVSTSGRTFAEFEQRSACLELKGDVKPDFGSLTLSSLNFNNQASVNSPQMIQDLAKKMQDHGIRPELEAFDLGMINYATYLIKKNLITPPYYFNLILGNIACAQANPMSLGLMINELPAESIWSAGGVGRTQLKMNVLALAVGGGVRVGLEDNIYFDDERTRLATNEELVARITKIAVALERCPYSHQQVRQILGVQL